MSKLYCSSQSAFQKMQYREAYLTDKNVQFFCRRQADSNFLLLQERHGKFVQDTAVKNGINSYMLNSMTLHVTYQHRQKFYQLYFYRLNIRFLRTK